MQIVGVIIKPPHSDAQQDKKLKHRHVEIRAKKLQKKLQA